VGGLVAGEARQREDGRQAGDGDDRELDGNQSPYRGDPLAHRADSTRRPYWAPRRHAGFYPQALVRWPRGRGEARERSRCPQAGTREAGLQEAGRLRNAWLSLEYPAMGDFDDPKLEWHRLFAEFLGTFLSWSDSHRARACSTFPTATRCRWRPRWWHRA
jgi:hypothetical protein